MLRLFLKRESACKAQENTPLFYKEVTCQEPTCDIHNTAVTPHYMVYSVFTEITPSSKDCHTTHISNKYYIRPFCKWVSIKSLLQHKTLSAEHQAYTHGRRELVTPIWSIVPGKESQEPLRILPYKGQYLIFSISAWLKMRIFI